MNKRHMIVALCLMVIATSALALGGKSFAEAAVAGITSQPTTKTESLPQTAAPLPSTSVTSQQAGAVSIAQQPRTTVPEHIIYRQLFRHVVILKKKAEEEERKGRDGTAHRSLYKQNAKLNDSEAAILEQIATESDRQISELDTQAQQIISAARAQHPGGQLAKGETLPPPPAELTTLQELRNNAILQSRDLLRANFGEEAFDRFDKFVQREVAPKIKPVQLGIPRPVLPDSPRKEPRK